MIMGQNNRESVYCVMQKVKVHFSEWGLLEGIFYQKREFCASKMYSRHYCFFTRKFLGSK